MRPLPTASSRALADGPSKFVDGNKGDDAADGSVKLGTPLVSGAAVKAKVLSQGRGDKVRIFKMRRRKHYQKRQGHRQSFTEIQITGISA